MKILYLNYYSTGEGLTIAIRTGLTEKELTKTIDDYLLKGAFVFDIEDLKNNDLDLELSQADILKELYEHVPAVAIAIENNRPIPITSYDYYINLA